MGKKQENTKIEELETRISDLESQLKRAVADYHNLEKRVAEGRSELTKWGTSELLMKLLPTLDHLDKALAGVKESDGLEDLSGWAKGVEMAVREFKNVLQSEGLEEISAMGVFDPALHEAVDVREMPPSLDSSGEPKDNIILEVVRKGYTLNGRVLRPAQVVVGKKNPPSLEETENLPGRETQSAVHSPLDEEGRE